MLSRKETEEREKERERETFDESVMRLFFSEEKGFDVFKKEQTDMTEERKTEEQKKNSIFLSSHDKTQREETFLY